MLAGRLGAQPHGARLHQVVDDQRADRDLGPDIEEDAGRPEGQPRPLQQGRGRADARAPARPLGQPAPLAEHGVGHHRQGDGEAQVAQADHPAFLRPIGGQGGARKGSGVDVGERTQDQPGAHEREDRGAQRIERLGEGQAAVGGLRLAEHGDQRVGHHLDDGDPRRQHEQRRQEGPEQGRVRGRDEQETPQHHHHQPRRAGAHVADAGDQGGARDRDGEVGEEEGRLDQHGLGVAEGEQLLQLGDQHVVEAGDAAEDEEQGEDEAAQHHQVAAGGAAGRPRRRPRLNRTRHRSPPPCPATRRSHQDN